MKRKTSSHLFYHHPELALSAENRFDPWQPLHIRENLSGTDEDLAWVETVGLVKKQALEEKRQKEENKQWPTCEKIPQTTEGIWVKKLNKSNIKKS